MFHYLYDKVKDISPIWWVLFVFLIYKNVFTAKKVHETVEGSLVERIDDFEVFNKSIKENDISIVDFSAV